MRNVINIVNFIRGCDPRADFDLRQPVREQIRLAEEYHMPMTFLYQYDALIQPEFIDLLKGKEGFELGIWLENSIWLIEKAGLVWRGRAGYNWDWHACVDMSKYVAYLIDTINYDNSISSLLDPIDRIKNCIEKYNNK